MVTPTKGTFPQTPESRTMSKASSQNRALRQARKALRHAEKRKRSPYVQARIKGHITAVAAGKRPEASAERTANRAASKASVRPNAVIPSGRVHLVGKQDQQPDA